MSDQYSFRSSRNGKYGGDLGQSWDHSTPVARRPEYRAANYEMKENNAASQDSLINNQRAQQQRVRELCYHAVTL